MLLNSIDFSRDEKKQLQEIVRPSSQVFWYERYYLISNIFSEFKTMALVNVFVLTKSDCPDKTIILEQGEVVLLNNTVVKRWGIVPKIFDEILSSDLKEDVY